MMQGLLRGINTIIALLGVLLAILIGVMWSREVLSKGTFGFDMGYLAVALGVSRILSARIQGTPRKHLRWLSLLAPIIPVLFFEAMAAFALNRLYQQLLLDRLALFALFSALMLLTVLILLVKFEYEEAFGPFLPRGRRSWRKWTLIGAVALGILIVWGPARILIELKGPTDLAPAGALHGGLVQLETWFYKSSLLVYLFMVVRMLIPTLQDRMLGD
jgi:hypothetical protein